MRPAGSGVSDAADQIAVELLGRAGLSPLACVEPGQPIEQRAARLVRRLARLDPRRSLYPQLLDGRIRYLDEPDVAKGDGEDGIRRG